MSSINISDFESYATNSVESHILAAAKEIITRKAKVSKDETIRTLIDASGFATGIINVLQSGYTLRDVIERYPLKNIIESGAVSLADFKACNVSAKELYEAGYGNLVELHNSGFDITALVNKKTVEELIQLGYGYPILVNLPSVNLRFMLDNNIGYCPQMVQYLEQGGVKCYGFTDKEMAYFKTVQRFDAMQIKVLNPLFSYVCKLYSIDEMIKAGYKVKAFKDAGYSAELLLKNGVSLKEIHDAGYPFIRVQFQAAGFLYYHQYLDAGYTLEDVSESLKSVSIYSWTDESLKAFKDRYGAKELFEHGFPLQILVKMGFTDNEIMA